MKQTKIPYVMMRGGTSRGPFMRRGDVPQDQAALAEVLIAMMGGGHPQNIDGLGGGTAVATKTAMLSRSTEPGIDIDYFFAQVAVEKRAVDFAPTCGNMLSAVGPAAVELGLLKAIGARTTARIRMVNTGAFAEAVFSTQDGAPVYDGVQSIDGVPGYASAITLRFRDTVGSRTGKMLPTGKALEQIEGVDVTCIDVAMPMVLMRAQDVGITGYEGSNELDANEDLFTRIESIRRIAGKRMGLGDVSEMVVPKIGVITYPQNGGSIAARYFMPWKTHPTMAVTGSQCFAACVMVPGSVASGLADLPKDAGRGTAPFMMRIEHPLGHIPVEIDCTVTNSGLELRSAGLLRTARMLARGEMMVPGAVWDGKPAA